MHYAATGEITRYTLANGRTVERKHDAQGRLIEHPTAMGTRTLSYDDAGQITQLADFGFNKEVLRTQSFEYDRLGRLSRFEALPDTHVETYAYDADGNRTRHTVNQTATRFEYGKDNNRLMASESITADGKAAPQVPFSYDATGSLIAHGTQRYRYDARGRMVQAITTEMSAQYACGNSGLRMQKSVKSGNDNALTTRFSYDTAGRMVGEYATNTNATPSAMPSTAREYVWWGNWPIAVIENADAPMQSNEKTTKEILNIFPDHLGTPREVAKQDSTLMWNWQSDPFGWKVPEAAQIPAAQNAANSADIAKKLHDEFTLSGAILRCGDGATPKPLPRLRSGGGQVCAE